MYGHSHRSYRNSEPPESARTIATIESAAVKAHSDLLAAGETISAWSVAKSALAMLNADSFESLGFHMRNVPTLKRLMLTEAEVNSFIHCFVGAQKITSLHDLEMEICETEGVMSFEELELGPILKHPLVVHYFSVGSDVTEICNITSEQIVAYLSILPRKDRKITVDDLFDFIAKKRKIRREILCIRIQSLGMHIGWIIRGRRTEGTILRKCTDGLDVKSILDDNEENDDDGNAAKDDEYDKNNDVQDSNLFSSQNSTASDTSAAVQMSSHERHSDCVVPLAEKQEVKIKLSEIKVCTKYVIHRTPESWMTGIEFKPEFQSVDVETGYIDDNAIDGHTWRFIKIWKDLCEKEENVVEVYSKMLDFYHSHMKPKTKTKDLNKVTSSYPYVGLLNVAIASIKFGLWDRISYFQGNRTEVAVNTCAADVKTEVEPAEKKTLPANKHVLEGVGISLEDVLKYVKAYYVFPDCVLDNTVSYLKKQLIFLREICKLECSLTQYFSVNDFETLGFGDIFTFLAEHISLLPTTWRKCFMITEKPEEPLLKVCMSQHYLLELLSKATNSLGESETLSKLIVSQLLRLQFPSAGLTLQEDDSTADLLTNGSKNDNVNSNVVLFSSALTDFRAEKCFLDTHVCTNDAIELLLRAPMLVDLVSWSRWDYKFAPSLGPLVGWLLSFVTTKELLCLVTKDGKVLRIDHLATVDSFLEAFLHGSSFETALKLVSLISLYGGERNVPLSLLKCHAKNGFKIMLKTSLKTASRFLLDCLKYLPQEFRSFVGEILVSAFRSIIKDAYMVILSECKSKKDHMIIHELGLSLGIVEWFDDQCSCISESKKSVENKGSFSENEVTRSPELDQPHLMTDRVHSFDDGCIQPVLDSKQQTYPANPAQIIGPGAILDSEREKNAANIIESIRVQEFGLDPNISITENSILKRQHARLGRALYCLSRELYSQDSHFLLKLVQNADDNAYPTNVEPTLTFILQEKNIVVLNNEHGFSAENIRAICDVGNSTKKESSAGYIGQKGIGFKSVFRITLLLMLQKFILWISHQV